MFAKCKGRDAQRRFINGVIPPGVKYSHVVDQTSADNYVARVVTRQRSTESFAEQDGVSLTEMEVQWGSEKVAVGLARGDSVHRDGLYYRRRKRLVISDKLTDTQVRGE